MNGGVAGLCLQSQLACACVCSGVPSVWRSFTSLWLFLGSGRFFFSFLSVLLKLLNRIKKTGRGEAPTK